MNADFTDDIRQAYVVAKNEIKKFMVGKKIILFGLLVIALELLNLAVPLIWGDGFTCGEDCAVTLLGNNVLFIVIAAILFTATSIVSEFEEHTALVLFTKPIKKWSIYFGKLLASVVIMMAFVSVLYIYTIIACVGTTEIPSGILPSFGLAACGVIATSGLAIMLSSIFKKGSTASIMTLVLYLLILNIVGALIATYTDIGTWWMLNEAMPDIVNSIGEIHVISIDDYYFTYVSESDLWRSAGAMLAWGAVTSIVGFFLFKRKDF